MKRPVFISLLFAFIWNFSGAQTLEKDVVHAFGLFESNKFEESVLAFNQVIDRYNKYDEKCRYFRGIVQYHLQHYDAARSDLQFAMETGNTESNLWMARLCVSSGQYKEAILFIENYLKESKQPDLTGIKKDSVFKKLHDSQEWFLLWQKNLFSEESKVHEEVAFFTGKRNFEKAHEVIETASDQFIDNSYLYELNSKVYFQEGIHQLALNEINKAISNQPENFALLKLKAKYLVQLNKHFEAVEMLTKVLEDDPGDFTSRFERANSAYHAGEYELAESDLQLYMKYFDIPDAEFLMGQVLYGKTKYLEALKYFNGLLKEDTSEAKYFLARGMTYYQTKTYKYAAYDLSMSLDLDPNNSQANLYLGITQYQLGNKELCCYYLKRAKNFGELSAIEYLQKYCD